MQTMRLVEGYTPPSRLRPGSLGLTLLTTGLFVSGLFFLNPKILRQPTTVLDAWNIPIEKPKPQPTPKPVDHPKTQIEQRVVVPETHNDVKPVDQTPIDFTDHTEVIFPPADGGAGTVIPQQVKGPPIMIGADIDPRYANNFQPTYPPDEIRESRTGRVTVRVLIGIDGRVKDIEKVSAPSDSFWEATRRQALSKWRFKPATRDGEPYETWKTMNVSFVLNQEQ
ncbi:MAG: energy transducer TonB [Pseudomonadota bacterium]